MEEPFDSKCGQADNLLTIPRLAAELDNTHTHRSTTKGREILSFYVWHKLFQSVCCIIALSDDETFLCLCLFRRVKNGGPGPKSAHLGNKDAFGALLSPNGLLSSVVKSDGLSSRVPKNFKPFIILWKSSKKQGMHGLFLLHKQIGARSSLFPPFC